MTAAGHCAPLQTKRLFCDSFVLSVKSDEERIYCGLNNGCVQVRVPQRIGLFFLNMGAVIIVFDNFHINVKQKYFICITFFPLLS